MTHKTIHTSEHNDWLWKTVRYMVQPYKIKSYSRAQHSTSYRCDSDSIRLCSMERVRAQRVHVCVSNMCEFSCSPFSFNSALTDNFPLCCWKNICSGCLTNISNPSTRPVFHSFKPLFPQVSLSFTRLFVVADIAIVSWNGGEVNEHRNEWMNERTYGWMLDKWKQVRFVWLECDTVQ